MSRIAETFAALRDRGRRALIPFWTVGYPSLEEGRAAALRCAEAGADLLELGVPFSDPLADGPTIQRTSAAALACGTTLADVWETAAWLRSRARLPLVVMSYLNPLLQRGLDRVVEEAHAAGVDGLLVTDLPPEEGADLRAALAGRGIDAIALVAPTTPPERARLIAGMASGFLYCIARTGVTGPSTAIEAPLLERLSLLRRVSPIPLAVGFGVAHPATARALAPHADGIVVGSAVLRAWEERGSDAVAALLEGLRSALDEGPRAENARPGPD